MRSTDLARLYDYTCWANQKLLGVVAQLTPQEFTKAVGGSYGSVRNTLVHIVSAEWGWLDRCGGLPRGDRLRPEDFPTLESIVAVWRRVEAEMRGFLDAVPDEKLSEDITFAFGGPPQTLSRGDILQHAVIHAVHHRGQISLLLRELGHTPGNYDFLFYAPEKRTPRA
jgi:uncharacterized damage-inducible protein DinB